MTPSTWIRHLGFLVALSWGSALLAADLGGIEGLVVNAGEGIGGVTVQVHQTGAVEITDEDGKFVFERLQPGNYTLLLQYGDDQMARLVSVEAGQTAELEVEVEWTPGTYETVKVTAAAAHAAKIVDAPAAVTSIDQEQIEREAAHGQLPKVLEFTPGAEITQSGLYDFNFNTRGFNSSLNRRVSTYIDGRDVGVVLLGAQEWAAISILDDLESLEFIRGPSAALYGANASSGVVNMTTKAPRDSQGGMARLTAGELDTRNMDIRWADGLGGGWYYKVIAGFRDTGDFSVSRDPDFLIPSTPPFVPVPEYSEFCARVGEIDCLLPERVLFREQDNNINFASYRMDKYLTDDSYLTFEGGATEIKGPVFQTGIGRVQIREADRPWARVAYARPHWNVLAHWARRNAHQSSLNKSLVTNFDLFSDTQRYGIQGQTNWDLAGGKGRVVVGLAHTEERVDSTDPNTGQQTIVFEELDTDRQALFGQFDWRFNEWFKVVFAGRVDANTLHDTQFSPKAGLVYNATPNHTFRLTFNKAFQVANYSEFFLHTRLGEFDLVYGLACNSPFLPQPLDCGLQDTNPAFPGVYDAPILAVGNDDLALEKTESWEVGYSAIIAKRAFLTVDYYNSSNTNFITDLVPQLGTSLGSPLNPDYVEWTSTPEAETTSPIPGFPFSAADIIRNLVAGPLGDYDPPDSPFGFQLARDIGVPVGPCENPAQPPAMCPAVVIARTYANVGEVETQGVDFGMQFFVSDAWKIEASYSWFDFEIINAAADLGGILLPNSPEHKASGSISFSKAGWMASASGRWVDEFGWCAGVFCGLVPAYYTTDLTANYAFNEHVELGMNVANVTDNIHRQTFGGDLLGRRALTNLTFYW